MKEKFEVTLLTKEEIMKGAITNGASDSMRLRCGSSDLAKLMGCRTEKSRNRCVWGTSTLEKHPYVGCIFTYVDTFGTFKYVSSDSDGFVDGIRPVLSFSSEEEYNKIRNRMNQNIRIQSDTNRIILEYGMYPQKAVSSSLNKELETLFENGILKTTGNIYTTINETITCLDHPIIEKCNEYDYNGKRYVRLDQFVGDVVNIDASTGAILPEWLEVSPINWIVDDENRKLISETVLTAGMNFFPADNSTNFKNSSVYKFLNDTFIREMLQSQEKLNTNTEESTEKKEINPYGLNFNEVSEEDIIKGSLDSGLSVFLHGQSSEGKSSRVKAIDPDCEIIYLGSTTLDMFVGKSVYNANTGKADVIKPYWLERLEEKCEKEPERIHIVFLDELTNAFPSVQSYAYNLVLDKKLNGMWQLPENARIVAAGNDMEDSIAAHQMPEPLFNRFVHVYIKTSVRSWLKWASDNNIHPAIYGFIAYKKDESLRTKYDGVKPNADPRKWEMASKMLYATGSPEMLRGLVGEDVTREFTQFCKQNIITLNDVINDNCSDREINALNVSEKYATTMNLTQVDEKNLEKVRNFTKRLGAEFCSLFESMWIHNDDARLELIAEARLADNLELERGTMR